jgi:hypothetical protein
MEFIEQKVSEDELRAHTAQQEVSATELETQRIEAALERASAERDDLRSLLKVLTGHPAGVQLSLDGLRRGDAPWIDELYDATADITNREEEQNTGDAEPLSSEAMLNAWKEANVVGPSPRQSSVKELQQRWSTVNIASSETSNSFPSPSSSHYRENTIMSPRRLSQNSSKSMAAVTQRDMKPDPAKPRFSSNSHKNSTRPESKTINQAAKTRPDFHPATSHIGSPAREDHNRPFVLSTGPLSSRGAGRLPTRVRATGNVNYRKTSIY